MYFSVQKQAKHNNQPALSRRFDCLGAEKVLSTNVQTRKFTQSLIGQIRDFQHHLTSG